MNSFENFMIAKYDNDELTDIAKHGCANVAPHGMIYYTETKDIYNKYAKDLHDILSDYQLEFGQFPDYVIESLGDDTLFYNSIVWFCAEFIAQRYAK